MTIHAAIKYYNDLADDIDKNPLSGEDSAEARQLVEWLEELKIIKEYDLDIPQHFTKEQIMKEERLTTENPLGYKPIMPLIIKYGIPSVLSMLAMTLYNIVDHLQAQEKLLAL